MNETTLRFDLLTLQLFVAVVEEQSIAQAAEKKHIAVSAVSRRISDLEDMLQVELLHRHQKGIEPTAAGLALLEHARVVLGDIAQLEADMLGHRQGARGHIRLHVNASSTLESLAEEISAFLVAHPQITIDLQENISPDIIRAIAENRADIGIFGGNIHAPGLNIFPYREDRLVAIVAQDHPLARRRSIAFTDMVEHEFVMLEKGSSIDTLCVRAAAELGRQLRLRVRVGGFDAMFRLVASRMGVGVAPQEIVQPRLKEAGLAMIRLDEPWTRRLLVLGVRDQAVLPPSTRLLLDHLRQPGNGLQAAAS
ncbi:MAG: LysR family transcriptional regulator [Alphaproteobacteria bacterium]|nr:LysR family transcriptional regulator [Alphaproteobacteria bacterium]